MKNGSYALRAILKRRRRKKEFCHELPINLFVSFFPPNSILTF